MARLKSCLFLNPVTSTAKVRMPRRSGGMNFKAWRISAMESSGRSAYNVRSSRPRLRPSSDVPKPFSFPPSPSPIEPFAPRRSFFVRLPRASASHESAQPSPAPLCFPAPLPNALFQESRILQAKSAARWSESGTRTGGKQVRGCCRGASPKSGETCGIGKTSRPRGQANRCGGNRASALSYL
jgi:hypothetical protein